MAKKLKKLMYACLVVVALVLILGAAAFAGMNQMGKVAVHVKAHGTSCGQGYPTFTKCTQIVFTWPSTGDVDVIPVVYELYAYTEIKLTLWWPPEWGTMSWVRCKGDASVGTFHNPYDYVDIHWTACQPGWSVAPGYGWLHAATPGMVCPLHPCAAVDCAPPPGPYTDWLCAGSCCGIGGMVGDDPCRGASATGQSTWGQIKAMFK